MVAGVLWELKEMLIFTEGTFQGSISLRFPDYRISLTVPSENKNACEIDETRYGIKERRETACRSIDFLKENLLQG